MQAAYNHNAIYTDLGGLAAIKAQSHKDKDAALKVAAQQFEALFLQMMLKQMREASFGDPLFDSSASDTYRSMFDQQISTNLSGSGALGIAKLVERQLGVKEAANDLDSPVELNPFNFRANVVKQRAAVTQTVTTAAQVKPNTQRHAAVQETRNEQSVRYETPADFVSTVWPHAEKAAQELGVPTEALVAQAVLETGWGKFVTQRGNGNSSFNVFNIKADHRWPGERVTIPTTEYRDGVVTREQANFRAYGSYEEAFNDYVAFLKGSARYSDALQSRGDAGQFLAGLQEAGYATDPNYASKISGIINGDTFAEARAALAQ